MNDDKYKMKMALPATKWYEATPCGNGKTGVLVYSNICTETILFNHEELFLPIFKQPQTPEMAKYLPKYRKMLETGRCHDAEEFWREALQKENWPEFVYTNPQHPAFDLKIYQKFNGVFSEYSRDLDMSTGEATVEWTVENKRWKRSVFVSRTEDAAFIHVACSAPHSICMELALTPHAFREGRYPVKMKKEELPLTYKSSVFDDTLRIEGEYTDGSGFVGSAKLVLKDGEIEIKDERLVICNATEALIMVKLDKSAHLENIMHQFPQGTYEGFLKRHIAVHGELFHRVTLTLEAGNRNVTNESLICDTYGKKIPLLTFERLFYFGRYLLISATGAKLPPNLQGVWNGEYLPPWSCAYTLDENIQMMHWQALPGKMPELMEPYFRFVEDSVEQWERNAQSFYGCKGILAPISQGNHAAIAENMPYLMVTCIAGWLAREFYLYYQYTGDETFLKNRALPIMEKAAAFYIDFSYENERGKLTICPSMSPENNPIVYEEGKKGDAWLRSSVNPTVDIAIFKELLANLCNSYKILGINEEQYLRYADIIKKLPPYELNADGALREWQHEKYGDHYRHRHISQLYPVYPGTEIHEGSEPRLLQGCKVALEKKMDRNMESMTCWGYIHMAHCLNRLGMPQKAFACLEYAVKGCLGKNFFMYINDYRGMGIAESYVAGKTYDDPVFQMDSNAGITSLIIQMVVDSYEGFTRILSGVPDDWEKGSLTNIQCIGGYEVSVKWDFTQKEILVDVMAHRNVRIDLHFPNWIKEIEGKNEFCRNNHISVEMESGENLVVCAKG